eukprot:6179293-Pleurochrysis_carterae.AAC.1
MFKASGMSALLKGDSICHNCLGWGHIVKDKSGKPVCPSAVKPRRPGGDCIDGVHLLKLRGNNSGSRPAFPGEHSNQQYMGSSDDKPKFKNQRFRCFKLNSKKFNKTFMLGNAMMTAISLASTLPSTSSPRPTTATTTATPHILLARLR